MRSYLRNVRAAYNLAAESASISQLYKPGWAEPKLYYYRTNKINGRVVHDFAWAWTRAFSWSARGAGLAVGAVTSALNAVAMPVAGTTLGLAGAVLAGMNDIRHGQHKGTRALRRGFVKGYTVGCLTIGTAELVAFVPVMAGQAVIGAAGAVVLTLPLRAAGKALDR